MKKLFVLAFVATSFALVSCGSKEAEVAKTDSATVAPADSTPVATPADTTPVATPADSAAKPAAEKEKAK